MRPISGRYIIIHTYNARLNSRETAPLNWTTICLLLPVLRVKDGQIFGTRCANLRVLETKVESKEMLVLASPRDT